MDQDSFIVDVTPYQDRSSLTPPSRPLPSSAAEIGQEYPGDENGVQYAGEGEDASYLPFPSLSSLLPMTPARQDGILSSRDAEDRDEGVAPPPRQDDLHYIWGTNISEEEFRQDFRLFLETFEAPVATMEEESKAIGRSWSELEREEKRGGLHDNNGGRERRWEDRRQGLETSHIIGVTGTHARRAPRVLFFIQELLQMYVESRTVLELNMTWVQAAAPEMFLNIVNQPTECGQMMNAVVVEMFHELIASRYGRLTGAGEGEEEEPVFITVAPKHMPQTIPLKALSPAQIETLISLKGMVIRVSKVIPEVRVACFECWNCLYTERSACGDRGRIFEPTRCPQCGKSYTFKLHHNLCLFEDKQLIKVQEAPENVSDGETPITITVVVYGPMVDIVIPGDRVVITGVYRSMPIRLSSHTRSIKSIFSTHLDALHVDFMRSSLSSASTSSGSSRGGAQHPFSSSTAEQRMRGADGDNRLSSLPFPTASANSMQEMTSSSLIGNRGGGHGNGERGEYLHGIVDEESHQKERLDMFYHIARREDIYDILLNSFARSIWGHEDVKRGILCQLFGGTPKTFVFSRSAAAGGTSTSSSPADPTVPGADPFLSTSSSHPPPNAPSLSTPMTRNARGMAAGGPNNASNSATSRAELNVLLCGDPGVAKSQLLTQVHEVAPRGVYTSGKGSSSVGLTAFVVKDQDTGDLVLEPGALVLSDKGLCCIDEFDKMSEVTRSVLLEVMEQQTLSIAKAGIIVQLNARTSLLAAANPKESQWNPLLNVVENLQIEPTLLSRFDLIFLFLDRHDLAEDRKLASHILSMYMQNNDNGSSSTASVDGEVLEEEEEEEEGIMSPFNKRTNNAHRKRTGRSAADLPIVLAHKGEVFLQGHPGDVHMPVPILSEYIAEARERVLPALTKASHQQLAHSYVELRKARGNTRMVSATLRQLESMIRLAESRAKMRYGDTVSVTDVIEAKRLMSVALKEAATDPKTGLIHLDMFHSSEQSNNSMESGLQRLESFIQSHYVSRGKTSCTVLELRHALNDFTARPGVRTLSADAFLELLSLAAGGDAVQSFTATTVTFTAPTKSS